MSEFSDYLIDDGFVIFLFHGVIRAQRHEVRNYTRKHLEEQRFVQVLRELKNDGVPVRMSEVVAATVNGERLPAKAFAITFDDGFENNYSVAAPILDELRVPCTFYVTTGFIESNSSSWIDQIELVVEAAPSVRLNLPFPELTGVFETRAQKVELLDRIRAIVKGDRDLVPDEFAAEVARQVGAPASQPDEQLDQKMTWSQARELHETELFTIGGHGQTHRILEFLDDSELHEEIESSLITLRTHLGGPIEHYSYPEGLSHCYSDRVIKVLRDQGIVCAPTAEAGTNRVGDDLFRLKRIMVN